MEGNGSMGEYYDWINPTRKEYLSAVDFDQGNKLGESCSAGNVFLSALYALLDSDWKGDDFIFLGDETEVSPEEDNRVLKSLRADQQASGSVSLYDYELEAFRCVSGLFKEVESEVRPEIAHIISDKYAVNYYRIDSEDPYRGLFLREGKTFRYTINDSKKEYYDLSQTEVLGPAEDKDSVRRLDPLPFLMAFGRSYGSGYIGRWIGDRICVSDERPPEDYRDMSLVYMWENRYDINFSD